MPFLLAPTIALAPTIVQPPVPSFALTLDVTPQVHKSQTAVVLFDDSQVTPGAPADPADADAPSALTVDVPGSVIGLHRVRVRVDGVDSIPMSRIGDTYEFDALQSVEVKA